MFEVFGYTVVHNEVVANRPKRSVKRLSIEVLHLTDPEFALPDHPFDILPQMTLILLKSQLCVINV